MKEIITSCKGINYAPKSILRDGQRVQTVAVLQKIPHNSDTVDITLKICRLNKRGNNFVDYDNPKLSITLTNEELNNLIGYIEENYKPLSEGAKKYIPLEENDNAEIIQRFKNIASSNESSAEFLVENGLIEDKVFVAVEAIKRKQSLDEFSDMLENDFDENYWQSWFECNKWVLGSDFLEILDDRKIDTKNIADYLMKAFDGFVDVVEIKRPSLSFWSATKDHDNWIPSTELVKAITQSANYLYSIERQSNSIEFVERVGTRVIKPRCLLVFGRSDDWDEDKQRSFRILNASYSNITIMTYDQIYARACNIMNIENVVIIDENDEGGFSF